MASKYTCEPKAFSFLFSRRNNNQPAHLSPLHLAIWRKTIWLGVAQNGGKMHFGSQENIWACIRFIGWPRHPNGEWEQCMGDVLQAYIDLLIKRKHIPTVLWSLAKGNLFVNKVCFWDSLWQLEQERGLSSSLKICQFGKPAKLKMRWMMMDKINLKWDFLNWTQKYTSCQPYLLFSREERDRPTSDFQCAAPALKLVF